MKGLTHFISGVAASTFIPEVVRMSAQSRIDAGGAVENSFIICLAGFYAVLPDTMDFKLGQFFAVADYQIDPDPRNPDPQQMAERLAEAIDKAHTSEEEVRVQFYPTQLGANEWRRYHVLFDEREVAIQFDEIVSTSQLPKPGTEPDENRVGKAQLEKATLKGRTTDLDWLNRLIRSARQKIKGGEEGGGGMKPSTLDILSGTQFAFEKESDGRVYLNWLPWHRTWSHSYVFGAILAIPAFVIPFLLGLTNWWLYGAVSILGFWVHLTEDMTGHIGGSLLWPLFTPRTEGFELFSASDPRTNFSIDYAAVVLIILNLDAFSTQIIPIPYWASLLLFLVIPLSVYFWGISVIKKNLRKAHGQEIEDEPDGAGEPVID